MKKVISMFFLMWSLFLISCSGNKNDLIIKKNLSGDNQIKQKGIKIEKYNEYKNTELTAFQKEIIKLAIQKGPEMCKQLPEDKINYCKNIIKEEKDNLGKLNCDRVIFFKQKCLDHLYFKSRDCKKIKDQFLERKCIFQKKYDQAIKNKNLDFCNTLPGTIKQECRKKILTK